MSAERPTGGSSQERKAIVDAAMAVFVQHGLEKPTVEEICSVAGVTTAAFARHFDDRDHVIAAVVDRVGTTFLDALIGTGEHGGDLALTFRRFENALLSGGYPIIVEQGITPREVLNACARSPVVHEAYLRMANDCLARLERVVRISQEAGRIRSDVAPEQVASLLIAAIFGMQTMTELKIPVQPRRLTPDILKLLEAGPGRASER